MSSNLACLGMAVASPDELDDLVERITSRDGEPVAESAGVQTFRWEDPSGARMVYDVVAGQPLILPSYATSTSFEYIDVHVPNTQVALVTVVGPDGSNLTGVGAELEQRRHLTTYRAQGRIDLVALGIDVQLHADEAAFLDSPASLMVAEDEQTDGPPEGLDAEMEWPPRMAAKSFFAHSGFSDPHEATPHAILSGIVLEAREVTHKLTGQRFLVVKTLTVFGEVDICLAAADHELPQPGQVLAGTVYLVGSLHGDQVLDGDVSQGEGNHEPDAGDIRIEDVDASPLPGESRREWRERTGR